MDGGGSAVGVVLEFLLFDVSNTDRAAEPETAYIISEHTIDLVREQANRRVVGSEATFLVSRESSLWGTDPQRTSPIVVDGTDPIASQSVFRGKAGTHSVLDLVKVIGCADPQYILPLRVETNDILYGRVLFPILHEIGLNSMMTESTNSNMV
jgi:hypothetical protein